MPDARKTDRSKLAAWLADCEGQLAAARSQGLWEWAASIDKRRTALHELAWQNGIDPMSLTEGTPCSAD